MCVCKYSSIHHLRRYTVCVCVCMYVYKYSSMKHPNRYTVSVCVCVCVSVHYKSGVINIKRLS